MAHPACAMTNSKPAMISSITFKKATDPTNQARQVGLLSETI
jgi:hypothetical protein